MKRLIRRLQRYTAPPYGIINVIFFVMLACIMLYSAVFSAPGNPYPVPSSMEILHQEKDISSGLSRSFSELVRGRIRSAREYNEYGPRIFLFFLLQLLMRPVFTVFYLRHDQALHWVYLDTGISLIFFVVAFWPFLKRFSEIL